jgi:hypothetical protein
MVNEFSEDLKEINLKTRISSSGKTDRLLSFDKTRTS